MILSEQPTPPLADDPANVAESADLDAQLKAIAAERDRHAAEKIELITKAGALSKELDDARAQLGGAVSERDKLRGELDSTRAERDAARGERDKAGAERDKASGACDAACAERDALRGELASAGAERERLSGELSRAAAEIAGLKSRLEAAGSPDVLVVLGDFITEQTKALVAKARAAIPPDSPALPWFDRTISAITTAGCVAVRIATDVARWLAPRLKEAYEWASPRVRELFAKAKAEVEGKKKD
jgi:hypothetical protein